jgi:hypothetical protein
LFAELQAINPDNIIAGITIIFFITILKLKS